MASGLILVDIQNEYFLGGRMELAGIRPIAHHLLRFRVEHNHSGDTKATARHQPALAP